jgi:hypothetical protein
MTPERGAPSPNAWRVTQAKGHGHGMHRAKTVMCTSPPQTGTAAVSGVDPTDTIEFDFSAQVLIKAHRH